MKKSKSEFYLKDCIRYNPDIHSNHCKQYTTKENELILSYCYSLADLSLILGRTAGSISQHRSNLKKYK
ncbi:MAG: hypothetical protein ACRC0S_08035 [Fusobacteriaceae bacterium]